MNAKEIFQNIKHMLNKVEEPQQEQKFETHKLADGTEVSCDTFEVGGIMTANGMPMAAGDYTLEDGTTVTIGEGGVIVAITPVQEVAETPAPEVVEPVEAPTEVAAVSKDQFDALQSEVTSLKAKHIDYEDQLQKANQEISKYQAITQQMIALCEALVKEPSVEPPVQHKKFSAISNVETKSKSINKYASAIQRIKQSV